MQKIADIVERELSCSAHRMDHVLRVRSLCLHLAQGEDVDIEVLEAAVLLHDIARFYEDDDPSGKTDHAVVGAEMAGPILQKLGFSDKKIKHIQECIISHRFRTLVRPKSLEAKILYDADKLDSVGAIGIARAYVWVGKNKAKIYTDTDHIEKYINENQGGGRNGKIQDKTRHSPQREYELKTKFLCEKLYTKKAKAVCGERVGYYKDFLDRLKKEIQGEI